jgi:hypothetical protein
MEAILLPELSLSVFLKSPLASRQTERLLVEGLLGPAPLARLGLGRERAEPLPADRGVTSGRCQGSPWCSRST